MSLSNRNRRDYSTLEPRRNYDFVWENGTLNLRRNYGVLMKTNAMNEIFRVENMYIPNLILMDFCVVALSVVKNGDFVWEMVCIRW